ncbi:VOC family protein [Nocardia salmonicida]|uniref:VOC family protein n=1 Tax=Nocardia salmonicida TaxID=53431 RepID=UPI003794BABB
MTARLGAVSIDSDEPGKLARFYSELLDAPLVYETPDLVVLQTESLFITIEKIPDHQPPDWPSGPVPKQLHLDLFVDDLDDAEVFALSIGARKPDTQPSPHKWRVLIDPSGHPFCVTLPLA